jgi:hypothetical protein
MELLIDIGVIISDLILSIFSGDEWRKIANYIKK